MNAQEFDALSPETRKKVGKKIAKILRWVDHSGGWNDVMTMAFSYVLFKAYEDSGFDVRLFPREKQEEKSPKFKKVY